MEGQHFLLRLLLLLRCRLQTLVQRGYIERASSCTLPPPPLQAPQQSVQAIQQVGGRAIAGGGGCAGPAADDGDGRVHVVVKAPGVGQGGVGRVGVRHPWSVERGKAGEGACLLLLLRRLRLCLEHLLRLPQSLRQRLRRLRRRRLQDLLQPLLP